MRKYSCVYNSFERKLVMDKSKKVIKTLKRMMRRNPKAKLEIKKIVERI